MKDLVELFKTVSVSDGFSVAYGIIPVNTGNTKTKTPQNRVLKRGNSNKRK